MRFSQDQEVVVVLFRIFGTAKQKPHLIVTFRTEGTGNSLTTLLEELTILLRIGILDHHLPLTLLDVQSDHSFHASKVDVTAIDEKIVIYQSTRMPPDAGRKLRKL